MVSPILMSKVALKPKARKTPTGGSRIPKMIWMSFIIACSLDKLESYWIFKTKNGRAISFGIEGDLGISA